ncbi:MAG: PhnD/SsuA/transferrin family substrate-binding protein [Chloroflexi bacterium]|nr:PhnD/SsuA/transferrin family substrate-binding protein [Chloroflexota bacterium]
MTRRIFLILLLLTLTACNLPIAVPDSPTATATAAIASTPTAGRVATAAALPTPVPDIPLGTDANPIVLSLPPSREQAISDAARDVTAQLSHLTGLVIVPYAPANYKEALDSIRDERTHIAFLSPFPYLLAQQEYQTDMALVTSVLGRDLSAAQFLVNRALVDKRVFTVYYDPITKANLADASVALKQFADKKPCWTDPYSATGYVLPFGLLMENGLTVKPGAFVQGHATVIKSLVQDPDGFICQFGVTIADNQVFIASGYDDASEKVKIVWMTEPVVPFDGIAYAASLPDELRVSISAAFLSMIQTEEGNAALRDAFQIDGLKLADDTFYDPLRRVLANSGLLLSELIK